MDLLLGSCVALTARMMMALLLFLTYILCIDAAVSAGDMEVFSVAYFSGFIAK
jgi:hypothetical protein